MFRFWKNVKKNSNRIHEKHISRTFFCSLAIEIHSNHLIFSPEHSKHNAEMASGIESIQSFYECQWPNNITMNYNWSNNIENKINTKYVGRERKAKWKRAIWNRNWNRSIKMIQIFRRLKWKQRFEYPKCTLVKKL